MTRAALVLAFVVAQVDTGPSMVLPAAAVAQLSESLTASKSHPHHVWRDVAPINPDGTVNGYIEISRGDRRKWEFDMAGNRRVIDRRMPDDPGPYPVNYGYVPQTVSYDGDPFDVLVTGAPIEGGRIVRGVVIGVFHMDDEKGPDSKVVISRVDAGGRPVSLLSQADRDRISAYFARYKLHEPGKFSKVTGWGSAEEGLAFVKTTHSFFLTCRGIRNRQPCALTAAR